MNNYRSLPSDISLGSFESRVREKKERKPTPNGTHHARIHSVDVKQAKTGRTYLRITFSTKIKGDVYWESRGYFPFEVDGSPNEMGVNIFRSLLISLGFTNQQIAKFKFNKHIPSLYGLGCRIVVVDGKVEPYKDIKSVLKATDNEFIADQYELDAKMKEAEASLEEIL